MLPETNLGIHYFSPFSDKPESLQNVLSGLGWEQVICPATMMGLHGVHNASWWVNFVDKDRYSAVGVYHNYRLFPFGDHEGVQGILNQIGDELGPNITVVGKKENIYIPPQYELDGPATLHHKMILKSGAKVKYEETPLAPGESIELLSTDMIPFIEIFKADSDSENQISTKYHERMNRGLPYFGFFKDNVLVGIAGCYGLTPEYEIGNIGDILVAKEFRNKGYGTKLIGSLIKYLVEKGADTIGCDVAEKEEPMGNDGKPIIYSLLQSKFGFEHHSPQDDIYYQNAVKKSG